MQINISIALEILLMHMHEATTELDKERATWIMVGNRYLGELVCVHMSVISGQCGSILVSN